MMSRQLRSFLEFLPNMSIFAMPLTSSQNQATASGASSSSSFSFSSGFGSGTNLRLCSVIVAHTNTLICICLAGNAIAAAAAVWRFSSEIMLLPGGGHSYAPCAMRHRWKATWKKNIKKHKIRNCPTNSMSSGNCAPHTAAFPLPLFPVSPCQPHFHLTFWNAAAGFSCQSTVRPSPAMSPFQFRVYHSAG